jgi:hypothetical protein
MKAAVILAALALASPALPRSVVDGDTGRIGSSPNLRRWLEDRTMKTYTVTYNVTLTIEVQADSTDEAERLADRELPSHCDVNCAVVCHRIATSPARTHEDN